MTLSRMHLAVAARCILTRAQGRVAAVFWASQVLYTVLQHMPETQCLRVTFLHMPIYVRETCGTNHFTCCWGSCHCVLSRLTRQRQRSSQ
jgi:hypothetical protein